MKLLNIKNNISLKKMAFLAILTSVMAFSSCNFLELESPDAVSEDKVLTTADGIRAARIGMYSALSDKNYYGGFFPLAVEAHSDNGANGGYAVNAYNELGNRSATPTNIVIEQMWLAMYNPINVANKVLSSTDVDSISGLSKAEQKNIRGEALFVRALCHFDVLKTFGEHWDLSSKYGVPLMREAATFDKVTPRSTVQESFSFIVNDLKSAEALLTDVGQGKTFVRPAAVKAMIARICIFGKDNATALKYSKEVIESGEGTLYDAADYGKIFTTKESQESIFEIGFNTQFRSSYNQLTYVRPDALRPEVIFLANADLNTFFKTRKDDVRAKMVNFDPKQNDISIIPDGRTDKYRGEQTKDNPAYVLRLAEQYLIAAEAGGKTEGMLYLNELRVKRGLTTLDNTISDADFANAVANERRAELNMEGHRLFDLARTGQVNTILGKDVKGVFPIPQREITATNGVVFQNQGY
jgi:starch-binding outer membrane protein, SusD/RagB family